MRTTRKCVLRIASVFTIGKDFTCYRCDAIAQVVSPFIYRDELQIQSDKPTFALDTKQLEHGVVACALRTARAGDLRGALSAFLFSETVFLFWVRKLRCARRLDHPRRGYVLSTPPSHFPPHHDLSRDFPTSGSILNPELNSVTHVFGGLGGAGYRSARCNELSLRTWDS